MVCRKGIPTPAIFSSPGLSRLLSGLLDTRLSRGLEVLSNVLKTTAMTREAYDKLMESASPAVKAAAKAALNDGRIEATFEREAVANQPCQIHHQKKPCPYCQCAPGYHTTWCKRPSEEPKQKPAIRVPKDHENIPVSPLSNPVVKRQPRPPLAASIQREAEGFQRTVVRFTGFYVQPLDPDNFAGSIKDLLDGLRHAGLIPGDEWWQIRLETDQVKVATKKEERTEIVIVTPELNKP